MVNPKIPGEPTIREFLSDKPVLSLPAMRWVERYLTLCHGVWEESCVCHEVLDTLEQRVIEIQETQRNRWKTP